MGRWRCHRRSAHRDLAFAHHALDGRAAARAWHSWQPTAGRGWARRAGYYWTYNLLKAATLWDAAKAAGFATAAVTWPVTVDAPITWNLPEYFLRRQGGAMDLAAIESKSTPGLVASIAAKYPSFRQQWLDDRTRAFATMYLLTEKRPAFWFPQRTHQLRRN